MESFERQAEGGSHHVWHTMGTLFTILVLEDIVTFLVLGGTLFTLLCALF